MSVVPFHPDTADGNQADLLDIGTDVDAMAALVAIRDIQPPLSIGLFGDWGTGKTFFMERMHARVARIARQPASERFCEGIVQIRFNAWHYVDANLWASLIDTLFRRLEEAVRGGEDGEARLRVLRERLQRAIARQQEIARELDHIEQRLADARDERDRVARDKEQAEAQAQRLRVAHMPTIGDAVREQIESLLREVRDNVGIQGLPAAEAATDATIDEAVRLLSDARLLRSRGSHLWQTLVHGGLSWRQWTSLGIGLLAPVAITALVAWLNDANILDWLSQPLLVLGELAVMLGSGARWARGKLREANGVLDRVDALRGELTVERDVALDRHARTLADAEREVARLRRDLARKQGNLERISSEAAAVRRQLEDMAPMRRMASFLSERTASDDYRKHLGLVALIRKDLEELSRLLALQDGAKRDAGLPPIDRIVLYIDDLDRCPPQRVVEMLQAVHLLLAFPLFVVVVAVDVRWVSRSLAEHYPALLDDAPPSQAASATSHDYLEKLFQIPFWIRPLTPASSAAMLAGLLDGHAGAKRRKGAGTNAADGARDSEDDDVPGAPWISRLTGTHVPSPARPSSEPAARSGHVTRAPATGDTGPPGDDKADDPIDEAAGDRIMRPERLRIQAREREVMLALSGGVGRSPRALKRFVNIYRLLKASLADGERRAFEPDAQGRGAYQPTLLALAILIGYPRLAGPLFDAIMRGDVAGDEDTAAGAAQRDRRDRRDRLDLAAWLDERAPDRDRAALSRMVETFCRTHPVSLAELRACLPRVSRYAFRHR